MGFFRPDGTEVGCPGGQMPDGWVQIRFAAEWPDADIYVCQLPRGEDWPARIDEMHAAGKKVVVELDDDHLHLPAYNPFGKDDTGARNPRAASALHACVRNADAVSVPTESLRASYKHLNRNIRVLRNRLHWPMWADTTPVYEQTWRRVRVGYMGRLDFHAGDLDVVRPWLGKWLRDHPEVEFVAAGDARIHDHLGVPQAQRVTTDRTDFRHLELPQITAVFDIGLVPLARNKFNEGKSFLKGLEYMACGIVPVATPTQPYRELVRPGVDGELAQTASEWKAALERLVADPALLGRMGRAARDKASQWTYVEHIAEWEDFYRELSPKPRLLWGDGDNADFAREEIAA